MCIRDSLHAAEWHIDPHKIGVLGFSAGGHLVAAISNHYAKRLYPAVDPADKESCRPDFAVAIYPGHLSLSAAEWDAKQGAKKFVVPHPANADKDLALNPDLHVTRQTPPTFLLQNEDDHVDNVNEDVYKRQSQAISSLNRELESNFFISVNLSPRQIQDDTLLSVIETALKDNQLKRGQLEIDVYKRQVPYQPPE